MILLLIASVFAPVVAAQAVAQAVRVTEEVMRFRRDKRVDPVYPEAGLRANYQGVVQLRIDVSKTGDVKKVELVREVQALPEGWPPRRCRHRCHRHFHSCPIVTGDD